MSIESSGTQSTLVLDALAWIEVHKRQLITGAIAIAAVAAAVGVFRWNTRRVEQNASAMLFRVGLPNDRDTNAPPLKAQDYLNVEAAYPGTRAGGRALLLAAGRSFADAQYAEALTQFDRFLSHYGRQQALSGQATYGRAACLDALNRLEEAANAYREVVASFPEDSVVDQARLGLARLAEAKNDAKEALRRYDEVMAAKSSGMRAAEARRQREALLRQHPELTPAPTPMPAATITNTITVTPASSPASASPPSTAGGKPPGS